MDAVWISTASTDSRTCPKVDCENNPLGSVALVSNAAESKRAWADAGRIAHYWAVTAGCHPDTWDVTPENSQLVDGIKATVRSVYPVEEGCPTPPQKAK